MACAGWASSRDAVEYQNKKNMVYCSTQQVVCALSGLVPKVLEIDPYTGHIHTRFVQRHVDRLGPAVKSEAGS